MVMTTPAASKFQWGVDVSSYQGSPSSWGPAEESKISWAAVKVTELGGSPSRYVNPDAAADWAWLAKNGKGRVAYLFGHPKESVQETVSFFAGQVKILGLKDDDGIALDHETTDGLSPAAVAAWAVKVQEALASKFDRKPLLYTYLSFASAGNCAGLGKYPLWIADPSSKAGHPDVPAPWKTWTIHQYSSAGNLDKDVAKYATLKAMRKALGKAESKEPTLDNLGGSVVGAVATARWADGTTVVAGLGTDGYIQAARWQDGKWAAWKTVSSTKAAGAPALLAFEKNQGRLYYTDSASNNVMVLRSDNSGATWT
jgi:GH25 family lysozyme M1 (1,4-beta-N-acetylmuramidase)